MYIGWGKWPLACGETNGGCRWPAETATFGNDGRECDIVDWIECGFPGG